MKIDLERVKLGPTCTIGKLSIDDVHICDTLEDVVREVRGESVKTWKIPGDTAIPVGSYTVLITYSPRFKKNLPLLLDVPGFEGIRIHAGNTHEDTEGCILVGNYPGNGEAIVNSRLALEVLISRIRVARDNSEDVTINIF